MPESLSPFIPFILFLIAGIVVSIYTNQRCRKTRNSLLRRIGRKKIKAVFLDTKVTWKATSFLSFHIRWENAEVIVMDDSILYFSYFSILGYRLYSQVTHWHLKEEVIPAQIRRSIPVESLNFTGGNLVIRSAVNHANVSTTVKDVASSGQAEVIRGMLHVSKNPYEEN
jgi:hypothetical protein